MGLPGLLKRRWTPSRRRLLTLVPLALLLGGCVPKRHDLPVMLYLAVSVQDEGQLTSSTAAAFRQRLSLLVRDFRRLHPNVMVQVALYPDQALVGQMRWRNWSGLGPDLILTGAEQANGLLKAGLVDPLPETPQQRSNSNPELLQRLRNHRGQLAGQPIAVFPQLACYDRRRLNDSPATLTELLQRSAAGSEVGVAVDIDQLLWTAGAFNAVPGLFEAAQGRDPSRLQRQAIEQWLIWLQRANDQQRFNYYPDQASLREGLMKGQLDWVSCNSAELEQLRQRLGHHLGVAPLPAGVDPPSPISRLRVMALGRNSSPVQRKMALALIRFSIGPLVQRSFSLASLSFLPSNPRVVVPVESSGTLAAMVIARQQGVQVDQLLADLHSEDRRLKALQDQVIVPLVFGQLRPSDATQRLVTLLGGRS